MKILTGDNIRKADLVTIKNEPISSLDLMERAAESIAGAMCEHLEQDSELLFIIGKGGNGGDGLAVARILCNAGFICFIGLIYPESELSEDCQKNLERLPAGVVLVDKQDFFTEQNKIIIDCITGAGMKGPVNDHLKSIVSQINNSGCEVFSIDLPSGMCPEFGNDPDNIVNATRTFTIQFPKLAMLLPEAGDRCGQIHIVDIELDAEFIEECTEKIFYIDDYFIQQFRRSRSKFSHKGTYGHALLVCGGRGMAGAAILSTSAALRSGCGLVTTHLPYNESSALFANCPSAIISNDTGDYFSVVPANLDKYSVLGIGCGIGQEAQTVKAFSDLLKAYHKPMVIDADAINILSSDTELMKNISSRLVFTPHPGELKRLIGEWKDDEDKIRKVKKFCAEFQVIIITKGAYTMICSPDGTLYFNSSGTPGLAKGGSGDVLTGFITGLIARGYDSLEASILGVFIHGRAGEKCADYYGPEGMNSSDLPDFLAEALNEI